MPFSANPNNNATTTAMEAAGAAEETSYLLAGRGKSSKSDNTRRSLDNSFRHIEQHNKGGAKPKNRRNSTSMVASLPHNLKDIKAPKKAKTPEPFQYESFKDISKKG